MAPKRRFSMFDVNSLVDDIIRTYNPSTGIKPNEVLTLQTLQDSGTLRISDMYLGLEKLEAVSRVVEYFKKLTTIEFVTCTVSSFEVDVFGKVLPLHADLERIIFSNSVSDYNGVKSIARHLPSFKNLKFLWLNFTHSCLPGITELANSLKSLPKLEYLNLSHNNISFQYMKILCGSLSVLKNLTALELDWNYIGSAGASELAQVLKCLPGLKTLSIQDNKITADGIKALAEISPVHPCLESLNVCGNCIGMKGARYLYDWILKLPCLKIMFVNEVELTPDGFEMIRACVSAHLYFNQMISHSPLINTVYADENLPIADILPFLKNNSLYSLSDNIRHDLIRVLIDKIGDC